MPTTDHPTCTSCFARVALCVFFLMIAGCCTTPNGCCATQPDEPTTQPDDPPTPRVYEAIFDDLPGMNQDRITAMTFDLELGETFDLESITQIIF